MAYDFENLLDDVKTFLTTNLNAQIAALNAEKNDGIALKTVNSTAYHFQYPEDRAEPSDPFIIYEEVDEPEFRTNGGGLVATIYRVGVTVVLADNGDISIVRRLFRYRRALLDLFRQNFASIAKDKYFTLHAWAPTPPFQNVNGSFTGRAIGIVLTVQMPE